MLEVPGTARSNRKNIVNGRIARTILGLLKLLELSEWLEPHEQQELSELLELSGRLKILGRQYGNFWSYWIFQDWLKLHKLQNLLKVLELPRLEELHASLKLHY
jgi:hypothetical protein